MGGGLRKMPWTGGKPGDRVEHVRGSLLLLNLNDRSRTTRVRAPESTSRVSMSQLNWEMPCLASCGLHIAVSSMLHNHPVKIGPRRRRRDN